MKKLYEKKLKVLTKDQIDQLSYQHPAATLEKYIIPAVNRFVKNVSNGLKPKTAFRDAVGEVGLDGEDLKNRMTRELISDVIAEYYGMIVEYGI